MENTIRITAAPSPVDPMKCTFTVDRPVLPGRSFFFGSRLRAAGSPLPEAIFALEGIESVLISHDQIHVHKTTDAEWPTFAKKIGAAVREILQQGGATVSGEAFESLLPPQEIRHLVQQVLDTQVNPMVASHGGHIDLLDVKENVVYIEMGGGCQGCGMASATLKNGVERLIREFVPEVGDILDVTDHAAGRNPYFQPS
ncbi:MAG: NifU family protein [Candidatus Eisenbacteria bacterium]|uniref:NifU family protein n=1 Tax=Eiseniibacteriota bacterium TaxID=2212470 RepID=A0A956RNZ6_UNCEI|nr:NifU family protein [Candidatus Eisenbacteria bacterium]